jgi:hypothetical protein
MQSCELIAYISAIACIISKCCSKDELSVIASFFTQLGDTLDTIIANEAICSKDVEE